MLGSTYYTWDTLVAAPTASGWRYEVVDRPTPMFQRLSIHITTLNPGAAGPSPSHHAQEAVVLIKEGTADVLLNGKTSRAGPGAMIFLSAHAVHSLICVGNRPVTYYVFEIFTAATASVPDRPADEWAPTGHLRASIFDCDRLPTTSTKNGSRCIIVDAPTTNFEVFHSHITTLNPGVTTGLLTDPADEVIVIKSGLVESFLKGVTCRLGSGSFYFQAANDVHSMTNVGSTPATYQVFKWVVRDEAKARP